MSRYGGAAAELLNRIVPILNDLGIETAWEVMLGSADFDAIVAAVSKGLAGVEQVVTEAMLARACMPRAPTTRSGSRSTPTS